MRCMLWTQVACIAHHCHHELIHQACIAISNHSSINRGSEELASQCMSCASKLPELQHKRAAAMSMHKALHMRCGLGPAVLRAISQTFQGRLQFVSQSCSTMNDTLFAPLVHMHIVMRKKAWCLTASSAIQISSSLVT